MINDRFEHLAARYVSLVAHLVPQKITSLVFSSSLSARSPDLCLLWHSGYRKGHITKLTIERLFSAFFGLLEGFVRLTTNFKPFEYALFGKINDTILVVFSSCGYVTSDGQFKTQYVPTQEDDAIFVFGSIRSFKKETQRVEKITFKNKLLLTCYFVKGGILAFLKLEGNVTDKNLLLLEWLSWALSLKWLNNYYLEKSLSDIIKCYSIKKIGCIHEMHSYARIVWGVAFKYKLKSYTLQHATITSGKRWYFCYPEEKKSGLILPGVMYAYNDKVIQLLKPYYEKTEFILGCSYRYSHWKGVEPIENRKGEYYLFVGALSEFDNKVLIALLHKLLSTPKEEIPIRVRFHPLAELSSSDSCWLRARIKDKTIQISKDTSLKIDIEQAIAVIGMSTTVLEEALLIARPVIQITHPDYLEYIDLNGIEGVIKKDYKDFLWTDLVATSNRKVDHEQMKNRLGLGQPLITYKILFS